MIEAASAKEMYRMELAALPKVARDQEQTIIEQARAGNQQARQHLIESCLGYVIGIALHYTGLHTGDREQLDFMDIVAAGNLRIIERIDAALQAPNPCGFLRQAARGAMADFCVEQKGTIRVPHASYRKGQRAPHIISLDAPLSYDDDRTLVDVIEA